MILMGRAARDLDSFQARRDEKPVYGRLISDSQERKLWQI